MYYLYILYSNSSDKFYVGQSSDPWRRLEEHNTSPLNTFSSKHRPWVIKSIFGPFENRSEAMNLEKFIKKQKSKSLLEKLIDPEFKPSGKLAQLVRVPHVRD